MIDQIKTDIQALSKKAASCPDGGDSMKYAQAALNLAHTARSWVEIEDLQRVFTKARNPVHTPNSEGPARGK